MLTMLQNPSNKIGKGGVLGTSSLSWTNWTIISKVDDDNNNDDDDDDDDDESLHADDAIDEEDEGNQ